MEHKIGEIFEYNGEWYQCVKCVIYCPNCDFFRKKCNSQVLGECGAVKRSDKENVIFKKLEKVGKPYIIGNKLIQRYKIYPTTYHINVYGWYYHNLDVKSWTIDIEIKQTKEDIEEKKQKWGVSSDTINEINKGIEPMNTSRNIDTERSGAEGISRNLKPFNLEAAKAGKPICTRDGRKARIICFDAKRMYPIIALIIDNGIEYIETYYSDGRFNDDSNSQSDYDLMMLPEKKEGWVNIVRGSNGSPHMGRGIFQSKEEAENAIKAFSDNLIDTVKISWEE